MKYYVFDVAFCLFLSFPVFWLFGFVSIVTLASWKNSKKINEKQMSILVMTLMGVMATYIFLSAGISGICHRIVRDDFRKSLDGSPALIDFSIASRSVQLTNPEKLARFQSLLSSSPTVGAHHSHPVNIIVFKIPPNPTEYQLGEDSANKDEFWLHGKNIPLYGGGDWTIMQFQSPALSEYLKELKRP